MKLTDLFELVQHRPDLQLDVVNVLMQSGVDLELGGTACCCCGCCF